MPLNEGELVDAGWMIGAGGATETLCPGCTTPVDKDLAAIQFAASALQGVLRQHERGELYPYPDVIAMAIHQLGEAAISMRLEPSFGMAVMGGDEPEHCDLE